MSASSRSSLLLPLLCALALIAPHATAQRSCKTKFTWSFSEGTVVTTDPWIDHKTVSVPLVNDDVDTGGYTLGMSINTPSNGFVVGFPPSAHIDASDDDPRPVLDFPSPLTLLNPTFPAMLAGGYSTKSLEYVVVGASSAPVITIGNASIEEGDVSGQPLHVPITIEPAIGAPVTLEIFTSDDTAAAGQDYDRVDTLVTIPAGQKTASVTVGVRGDTAVEADETFRINGAFTNNSAIAGVTIVSGTATILNDDRAMTSVSLPVGTSSEMSIELGNAATSTDSVSLSSSNPAIATVPSSVTVAAGAASHHFTVSGVAPGTAEISATLPAWAGGATVTGTVRVYVPATLTAQPASLSPLAGTSATVALTMVPAPAAPLQLAVTASSNLQVPSTVTIDATGHGTLTINALLAGSGLVTIRLPEANGGVATSVVVNVQAPAAMVVTGISPASGPPTGDTAVTLTGQLFTQQCRVSFDTTAASTYVVDTTTLKATTPPHAAGTVDVTVTCGTASSVLRNGFTYALPPAQLVRVTPTSGTRDGGTFVTVSGTNMPGSCGVFFGNASATIINNHAPSFFDVTAPPHATAEAVDVTLRCPSGDAALAGAFTYSTRDDAAPVITDVQPSTDSPNKVISVAGTGFRQTDTILFGDKRAAVSESTPTQHFVFVPDLPEGSAQPITVRSANGAVTTSGVPFTIAKAPAPVMTSVSPTPVAPGGILQVLGTGFRTIHTFRLGGTPLSYAQPPYFYGVYVRVPDDMTPGTYAVSLTDSDGQTLATKGSVTVSGSLVVTGASPQCVSASGGTKVTITGSGFASGARVLFNGVNATSVSVISENTIEAVTPEGRTGWCTVTVINPGPLSQVLLRAFYYYPSSGGGSCEPRIDDPGIGAVKLPAWSQSDVELRLAKAPAVPAVATLTSSDPAVVAVPATVTLAPDTWRQTLHVTAGDPGTARLTATLPASAGGATYDGVVSVYVPGRLSAPRDVTVAVESSEQVTLQLSPPPAHTIELPVSASTIAVTVPPTVVIDSSGRGVLNIAGRTVVSEAIVTIGQPSAAGDAETHITVHVDPLAGGLSLASASPSSGPIAGGTRVTISGTNFGAGCTVAFGRLAATSVTIDSPRTILATTPAHNAATTNVTVTCGTRQAVLTGGFTFAAPPPQLTSAIIRTGFNYAQGTIRGGTLAYVSGTNLRSTCRVLFGGAAGTIITDSSPSQLIVETPPHAAAETVDVTFDCGDTKSTLAGAWRYFAEDDPLPVITSAEDGFVRPGFTMKITGLNFRTEDEVWLDKTKLRVLATTPETHTVIFGDIDGATPSLQVRRSALIASAPFPMRTTTSSSLQKITAVSPARVAPGGELTITGTGLVMPYSFIIGSTRLTIVDWTSTRAIVRVPPSAPAGTSALQLVNAQLTPVVTGPNVQIAQTVLASGVSPQCTSAAGGALLTITGSRFAPGTRVFVGDTESDAVTLIDGGKLTAVAPPGRLGPAAIKLVLPNGDESTLSNAITYYSPFSPPPCAIAPPKSRGAKH